MSQIINVSYSNAEKDPVGKIALRELLKSENLCYEDLDDIDGVLNIARLENEVIGGFGVEIFGENGLLRSVVLKRDKRRKGLGVELVEKAISCAKGKEVNYLYLLTTTADKFFKKLGFQVIPRNSVPGPIAQTTEFRTFCPDTAICMKYLIPKQENNE